MSLGKEDSWRDAEDNFDGQRKHKLKPIDFNKATIVTLYIEGTLFLETMEIINSVEFSYLWTRSFFPSVC